MTLVLRRYPAGNPGRWLMTRKSWIFIAAAFFVIALPALVAARAGRIQKSQEASADKAPIQTLKVDVDLVLVNATVTDSLNRYVSGLDQEHFQIWEDKLEQKIRSEERRVGKEGGDGGEEHADTKKSVTG